MSDVSPATRRRPRIRAVPEDFRVDEIALYPPAGEGAHTFVRVEKRLRTTEEVARDLARAAGTRPQHVGYAGRKDRLAVTTQWLSVPDLDPEAACALALPGARVLEAVRHPHKLRTGQLAGNRFELVVRDVDDALHERLLARLGEATRVGLPNRFGEQRFGRDGDNAQRARAVLRGERIHGGRRAARFLVSALQAAVFNDVLEGRPLSLDAVERGDVAVRHDSGGLFVVMDPATDLQRARNFEISATGPIFGHKVQQPEGAPAARERGVLEAHGLDPAALPRIPGLRLRGSRRALRVRPADAEIERRGTHTVLCFALPPGSYATVVLEDLLGEAPLAGGGDGPAGAGVSSPAGGAS